MRQLKAYKILFDAWQLIAFQKKINDPVPQVITMFPNRKVTSQFIVLNPFKKGAKGRSKTSIEQIQAITVEQDCISKDLQREHLSG